MIVTPSDSAPEDWRRQDFDARIKRAKMDQSPLAVLVEEMRDQRVSALAPGDAANVAFESATQPKRAGERQAIRARHAIISCRRIQPSGQQR